MRKNQVIALKRHEEIDINQHWHALEYLGADAEYLRFQYHKPSDSCKVLIPVGRVNEPISIMKNVFEVESYSPDRVKLKYVGRAR